VGFAYAVFTVEQEGIAKFMSAIGMRGEISGYLIKHGIPGEGAQQFKMAFTGLMDAGENGIDNAQACFFTDSSARNAIAWMDAAIVIRGRFKSADYGCSNGNDAPSVRLRPLDRERGPLRDLVWFIQGKLEVEQRISGR